MDLLVEDDDDEDDIRFEDNIDFMFNEMNNNINNNNNNSKVATNIMESVLVEGNMEDNINSIETAEKVRSLSLSSLSSSSPFLLQQQPQFLGSISKILVKMFGVGRLILVGVK